MPGTKGNDKCNKRFTFEWKKLFEIYFMIQALDFYGINTCACPPQECLPAAGGSPTIVCTKYFHGNCRLHTLNFLIDSNSL
jgi:hypothetical protein